jgi:hypothetical protein
MTCVMMIKMKVVVCVYRVGWDGNSVSLVCMRCGFGIVLNRWMVYLVIRWLDLLGGAKKGAGG